MSETIGGIGVRIGQGLIALAVAAAIGLSGPAPAGAATGAQTVGWVPGAGATGKLQTRCQAGASFGWAQLASQNNLYTVPSTGVITSWTFQTGQSAADELYLVVYRGGPALDANFDGAGTYTPVAWSPALIPLPAGLGSQPTTVATDPAQAANTIATYPARIPVKAGDVLGVAASCLDWYPSQGGLADFPFATTFEHPTPTGAPFSQQTQTFPYQQVVEQTLDQGGYNPANWPGYRLPISAQVEPDGDGDGFGDVTQDLCPGVYGSVEGCPEADLSLLETVAPTSPGPDMTFALTVTNHGPDPVPDPLLTDALPSGTTLESASTPSGTCSGSATVTCQLSALASGQSATITLVLRGSQAGTVTNTASVASQALTTAAASAPGAGDPDAANNIASATTTLAPATGAVGSTASGTSVTPLTLGNLRQSNSDWRESRSGKSKLPVGDTFRFTLSRATTVTLTFVEQRPGRRVRGACVALMAGNAGKPHCTRTTGAGTLTLAGRTGANSAAFKGRLPGGRLLAPGTCLATFNVPGTAGQAGTPHRLTFTIAP